MGSRDRLRDYFLKNVGRILSSDELRKASGDVSEWARRVRELRNEEGYQILTHNDRADLRPGEYLLEDPKPLPAFERKISKELRALVLDRNGYTCQMCGAEAGQPHPLDPRRKVRLHIGHYIDKSAGGTDEIQNLRALCSVCNEGAKNLTAQRPDTVHLLSQIRRASRDVQLEVYRWLERKFGGRVAENSNEK